MKKQLTPIAYPTTPEEDFRWGFDVYKPVSTPKAWVLDWDSASAGFGISEERVQDVIQFKTGEDLSQLTVDDVFAGHTQMFKIHWHTQFKAAEKVAGKEVARKIAFEVGDPLGARGWEFLQKSFGKPVPLDKIVWYQDIAHMLYGPDTHAYSWCDEEKSICCRTRCLFRPPKGMEHSACYCRIFDTAYIEAYMKVEPDLLCLRVPDLSDDSSGPRCIHMWTYTKSVVENLPDNLKVLIPETSIKILEDKGCKL